jgi:dTDP-4-amino-4,6-dideoxyglucose formyltransferase
VFSILNGQPLGATLHEIDEELDHGAIIDQLAVPLYSWDTSLSAYLRVQEAERMILLRSMDAILAGTYAAQRPHTEGNVNLKADFDQLCRLDLDERMTLGQAINRLRALSHGSFKNAHFIAPEDGRKVHVRLELEPEFPSV